MLKKAGIIVATAATGLLAVTSFAFADTSVDRDNLTNDCAFGQTTGTIDNEQTGGSALAAPVNIIASVITPATAQAPAANCTNVGVTDLLDTDSNNTDKTVTETKVEDSFNTED